MLYFIELLFCNLQIFGSLLDCGKHFFVFEKVFFARLKKILVKFSSLILFYKQVFCLTLKETQNMKITKNGITAILLSFITGYIICYENGNLIESGNTSNFGF